MVSMMEVEIMLKELIYWTVIILLASGIFALFSFKGGKK